MARPMAETGPNILLLMTDQQRYDSLGCYGAEFAHTPNLDRLAAEGALFERCYVNNPICTPSRASLFTGKHLHGHGVYRLYDNLPEDEVLFPERLQALGYTTALFGKLHVSSRGYEETRRHPHDGFDIYEWCMEGGLAMDSPYQAYAAWLKEHFPDFYARLEAEFRDVLHHPAECHMTHWAAERAIDFIDQWDGAKPFFCMASIFDPHNPYEDFPLEMAELVNEEGIPDPRVVEGEFAGKPPELLREHHHSYMHDFSRYSLADLRRMRFGYHASIAFLDQEFGRVLDALERRGIADNTLVIFTSDHGDMLGDHQLLVKGAFFYDANVRVPLIMRWPERLREPRRVSTLAQIHDLAATILTAAGTEQNEIEEAMPAALDLLPAASGEGDGGRNQAICCYRNSGLSSEAGATPYFNPAINATMLRRGQYKLNLWHGEGGASGGPRGELYDMDLDPFEQNNLWDRDEYREVRLSLTERLLDWFARNECSLGSRGGEALPGRPLINATR
ncbi:MAG: sulfatase-like hydrolase/transferase [Lentisphaerae bacterium]|nr:sulfatase-like hydrolase/transferase [Lentisphaerota bacterium]MBT5604483.1 sulfatase-like hydrolase/transferase [Lentisphaerota bacterium]MBT7060484.1 sulfatase-like hydrolase/transferase [Lentisphaerota bacterium]MBT7844391.1 sulfatase-like hydrolase/transferase [Lentisphaerota bacterium]